MDLFESDYAYYQYMTKDLREPCDCEKTCQKCWGRKWWVGVTIPYESHVKCSKCKLDTTTFKMELSQKDKLEFKPICTIHCGPILTINGKNLRKVWDERSNTFRPIIVNFLYHYTKRINLG